MTRARTGCCELGVLRDEEDEGVEEEEVEEKEDGLKRTRGWRQKSQRI